VAERSYHIGEVKGSIPFRAYRESDAADAAVDDEAGAGHEGGIVRREKDDALGNVGHRPHAADRDARQRPLGVLVDGPQT
jgi:hypothetical protein